MTLPDGEVMNHLMATQNFPHRRGNLPFPAFEVWALRFNKIRVSPVCHKTDSGAIGFIRSSEFQGSRNLSNLRFSNLTEGEKSMGKLSLCEREEKICLVFLNIGGSFEMEDSILVLSEGNVMPGGD